MPFDPNQPFDVAPSPAQKPWSGAILPVSRDAQGNVQFDSNAGILGSIKRAVTLPGDVAAGRVDPMSDEGIGRSFDLAATIAPVNPMARSGDYAVPGVRDALVPAKNVPVPSAKQLLEAGGAGFDAVRDMGVVYRADKVAAAAQTIKQALEARGVFDTLAPKTHDLLNRLASPPEGSVATGANVEAARRAFGEAARDFSNPTEQMAASSVLDGIDDFVMAASPEAVVAGPASEAGKTLAAARGNYAAGKRSEMLGGLETRAQRRASASNSGHNLGNAIRGRVATALDQPKQISGFSEAERAQLDALVTGSRAANATREVGNRLGGGGGWAGTTVAGMGAGVGAVLGGAPGAVVGAAVPAITGAASRGLSNRLTEGALEAANETVRMRSPLYEQLVAAAADEAQNPERYAAILRLFELANARAD